MNTSQFETLKSELRLIESIDDNSVLVYYKGDCLGIYSHGSMKLDVLGSIELEESCEDLSESQIMEIECMVETQFQTFESTQEITEEHFRTYIY